MGNDPTTPRQQTQARRHAFAKHIVEGKSLTDAYLATYGTSRRKTAAEKACRLSKHPAVVEEIRRLTEKSEKKALLTLNDRLGILAEIAQDKPKTSADKNAVVRAVEVYSRISGDQAPQRIEATGKDGAPIAVAATVLVSRLPVKARIEAMRAARAAQGGA